MKYLLHLSITASVYVHFKCMCARVCVSVCERSFCSRLQTYGSQLECNVRDDKRDSDWSIACRYLLWNTPAWVACVCVCVCWGGVGCWIQPRQFNKGGVWRSHLLSDTQEAQQSEFGFRWGQCPRGLSWRNGDSEINGQETRERRNRLLDMLRRLCVSWRCYVTEYGMKLQIKCVLCNGKEGQSLMRGNLMDLKFSFLPTLGEFISEENHKSLKYARRNILLLC